MLLNSSSKRGETPKSQPDTNPGLFLKSPPHRIPAVSLYKKGRGRHIQAPTTKKQSTTNSQLQRTYKKRGYRLHRAPEHTQKPKTHRRTLHQRNPNQPSFTRNHWKCCSISSSDRMATWLSFSAFSAFSTSLGLRTKANLPSICTADE